MPVTSTGEEPGEAVHAQRQVQAERRHPGELSPQHATRGHSRVGRPDQPKAGERDGAGQTGSRVARARRQQAGCDGAREWQADEGDQEKDVRHHCAGARASAGMPSPPLVSTSGTLRPVRGGRPAVAVQQRRDLLGRGRRAQPSQRLRLPHRPAGLGQSR